MTATLGITTTIQQKTPAYLNHNATTIIQIRYPVALLWSFPISQNVDSVPFPYKVEQTPSLQIVASEAVFYLHPSCNTLNAIQSNTISNTFINQ